jgi:hypothetical protein
MYHNSRMKGILIIDVYGFDEILQFESRQPNIGISFRDKEIFFGEKKNFCMFIYFFQTWLDSKAGSKLNKNWSDMRLRREYSQLYIYIYRYIYIYI